MQTLEPAEIISSSTQKSNVKSEFVGVHPLAEVRNHRAHWVSLGFSSNEINVFTSVFLTIDVHGIALATNARIQAETGLSRRTVQRILKKVPTTGDVMTSPHPLGIRQISRGRGHAQRFTIKRLERPARPAALTPPAPPNKRLKELVVKASAQIPLWLANNPASAIAKPGPIVSPSQKASSSPLKGDTICHPQITRQVTISEGNSDLLPSLVTKTPLKGATPAPIEGLKPTQASEVMGAVWATLAHLRSSASDTWQNEKIAQGWRKCPKCAAIRPPYVPECPKCGG